MKTRYLQRCKSESSERLKFIAAQLPQYELNSELRGIEQNLNELEGRGVRPIAISVDPPGVCRALCQRHGYTYTFLSDLLKY
jgi:hypothetical protein